MLNNTRSKGDQPPLIAHVIFKLAMGGLENGMVNLINLMPHELYRHVIVCIADYTDFRFRIRHPDVEVIALHKSAGWDLSIYPKLYRLFRRLKPDVVHSRSLAGLDSLWPARLAGVPCCIQGEHGRDTFDPEGHNRKLQWLRRLHKPLIDHYIALSKDLERYLIEKIRVPRSKITQIYNGVDCQRFQITLRRAPLAVPGFAGPDAFIFGTVGRFQPIKDQLTLVKAFIHLLNLAPDLCHRIRLVAVGDGPLRQQAIELLHAANASDYAWLPGERDDVPEILHALDVFVLPSLAEGISNTILEAMASGLPVIATQVGGNLELVVDGSTGRLVPAADPLALMQAMEGYLRNPQKAREHGRAGRCRVEDHFSIEQMVGQYLGVYDAVLRQKTEKGIARDRTRPSLHRH